MSLGKKKILSQGASGASDFFTPIAYSGAVGTSITGFGFQPDLLWIKARNTSGNNRLFDSVRGASAGSLSSDKTTGQETGSGQTITSFDSDGFSAPIVGGDINQSSVNYVAWGWLAGGASSSNSNGSVTSTVSANVGGGFSIVKWTGDGSTTQTVGHGLSAAPELMIFKLLASSDWQIYTTVISAHTISQMRFEQSNSAANLANMTITSSTFTNHNNFYPGGETIAYCFHSVAGFSKVSTYSGDGTNDFSKEITVGFQPQFVLLKAAVGGGNYEQWNIVDSARGDEKNLYASANSGENGGNSPALYGTAKLTSTGFQVAKGSNSSARDFNYSGAEYLYMAFA